MTKYKKFLDTLLGHEVTATNGEIGYLCTIGDLLNNGGRNDFFRWARKCKNGDIIVSHNVYKNLQYDRQSRTYYANCYTNACMNSPNFTKKSLVFIGFTF